MSRSKEFDETAVLQRAMLLFWRNGYEKTSMQDLVDFMNIHRRSIYDTFGDKKSLFLKALQLFENITERRIRQHIEPLPSVKSRIRTLFEMTVLSKDGKPPGCLIVNTATELSLHDPEIAARIQESFQKTENILYEWLVKGKETGELPAGLDAKKTAAFIHNAFVGIRVQAKTSPDPDALHTIVEMTLTALD